jgi:hypothetical protein
MHSLHRFGDRIEISEFKNVIGRAGRAYVDVEGIVLFPMFDDITKKRRNWEALINDLGARNMESGLVQLVAVLLRRMRAQIGGDLNQLIEYVVNNAAAWTFPEVADEKPDDRERALADWERHVATLDTAILSLIGENDIPDEGIEAALDDILQSSLAPPPAAAERSGAAGPQGGPRLAQPAHLEPVDRSASQGLFPRRRRLDDRACARRHRSRRQPPAHPGERRHP